MTTHVDIIKAIAREDATVNDEAPFAECAVDTWYTDSVDAEQIVFHHELEGK